MLLNPYRFGPPPSPLLTGLVSYWKLDEASGNAIDAHGLNPLTVSGGPGSGVGIIGNARSYTGGTGHSSTSQDFTTGDVDFTVSCWARATDFAPAFPAIFAKTIASVQEYVLIINAGKFAFRLNNGGVQAVYPPATLAATWYHFICWHDSVANQIGMVVNGEAPILTAHSTGITPQPTAPFSLGMMVNGFWNGRIDEVGFWRRMLTPAERAVLYNLGDGATYPSFTPAPLNLLLNLVAYWKMDEASGNAIDAHGTNTLTDTNTVTSAAGKINTARSFASASSEYFVKNPSGADLSCGNIDFTFAFWMRAVSTSIVTVPLSKWDNSLSQHEFLVVLNSGAITWHVGGPGGNSNVTSAGGLVNNTWYHVVVWHDSVNDKIGIGINNASPVLATANAAGVSNRPAQAFILGVANAANYWNGQLDEIGFWKRMLTNGERAALYNSGNGLPYSSFT